MPQLLSKRHDRLRRLHSGYYNGYAFVHWSMTIQQRKMGWLDSEFHYLFREELLHSIVRYDLACPIYCLMPDHMHILLIGLSENSNQTKMMEFFRKRLNIHLQKNGVKFQKQAYDHVLKEHERKQNAFQSITHYILENPVRKDLVTKASEWLYSGCLVAGYPDLDPKDNSYWDRFWRIYQIEVGKKIKNG